MNKQNANLEAKKAELQALFGNRNARVGHDSRGWTITLYGESESSIKTLAALMNAGPKAAS
jgi:hypothetical protein